MSDYIRQTDRMDGHSPRAHADDASLRTGHDRRIEDARAEARRAQSIQAIVRSSPRLQQQREFQAIAGSSQAVQCKPRGATVAWTVTHAVRPDASGSLFGSDADAFQNEDRELHQGDRLVVDDEEIFRSRRGANQELPDRRQQDREGHLVHKWLRLLEVNEAETDRDGYVREETITLDKESSSGKKVALKAGKVDADAATKAGAALNLAWAAARAKRRMSTVAWENWEKERMQNEKETSPSWDPLEEGYDVSANLAKEDEYEPIDAPADQVERGGSDDSDHGGAASSGPAELVAEEQPTQAIFKAYDQDTGDVAIGTPLGIIVIEKAACMAFPRWGEEDNKKWYLRWLVGHPATKGVGALLLESALNHVKEHGGEAVWVDASPSAVSWYQGNGFAPVTDEEQLAYNEEFASGWDSVLMVMCPVGIQRKK
jgi:GNAT superfamily N-acetyltransferase